MLYTTMNSPIGELLLLGDERALRGLHLSPHRIDPAWRRAEAPFAAARAQLDAYFAGDRIAFDLPLALDGGPFEREVWDALLTIPYGQTRSYGEIAARVGRPGAARAVGAANGRNPVAIVVPCHRVIGADRSLTGYGGGLARKRWLLDHEAGVRALV
jgi:methylated-DNA-[protein]-cysteine S-methyltransferase